MRAKSGLSATACLLALLAVPARAQDDGYGYHFENEDGVSSVSAYAGLRGSFAFSDDSSASIPTSPATKLRTSYDNGGGGSFYVGTHLPWGLKLEFEGLYRYLPVSVAALNGVGTAGHGTTQIAAPMANLMWDLPLPDFPIRPFIGAGVGGAYVDSSINNQAGTTNFLQTNSWQLAYDFMGGAEFPLGPTSRLTAMYRWLEVNGVTGLCGTSGAATLACRSDVNSQSVDLGLEMDL